MPEEAVYILHIELPSGDKFDVQVNNTEMLQEIHQVIHFYYLFLRLRGSINYSCDQIANVMDF